MINAQMQKVGDNAIGLQARGDIILLIDSSNQLAEKILLSVFGELPDPTIKLIKENQASFATLLIDALRAIKKEQDELKLIVESPDFQYYLKQATISASKSSSSHLHKNLAALIVQRINMDGDDFRKIIFNQAIVTLDKITQDQLKFLTFRMFLKDVKFMSEPETLEQFFEIIESRVLPLSNFKMSRSDFSYLIYAGCTHVQKLYTSTIFDTLKNNYPKVFPANSDVKAMLENHSVGCLLLSKLDEVFNTTNLTAVGEALACTYYGQLLGGIDIDSFIK